MPLSIRIISSPDGEPITQWNQSFPDEGGEIGRAFGSIMQLSDAMREVSSSHAIIRQTSRGYQIEDNSSNGLFINGSLTSLGQGNIAVLNDGDVLDVGRYRLLVSCVFSDKQSVDIDLSGEISDRPLSHDDPFKVKIKLVSPLSEVPQHREKDLSFSSHDLVLDDPFLFDEKVQSDSEVEFLLDFNMDDGEEPFSEEEYKAIFPALVAHPDCQDEPDPHFSRVNRFRGSPLGLEEQIDKAIDMAFTRFLSDISPPAMEEMFDELSNAKSWFGKPKYWARYKRYFARQLENRDWKIKFLAYFHDALRVQKNMNGGDR